MALRGAKIAKARIEATVDGSGVNKGLVDAVDDATDGMDKQGEEGGENYGRGFSKGFISRLRSDVKGKIEQRLSKDMGDAGAAAGDAASDGMGKRMTLRSKAIGSRVGDTLGASIASALGDRLEESFAVLFDTLEKNLREMKVSGNTQSRNAFPLPAFDDRRWAEAQRLNKQFEENRVRLAAAADRLIKKNRDAFGDRVGGMLGAGSRNNALNLFGKSLGNLINLTNRARSGVGALFNTIKTSFSEGGEGFGGISKAFSGIAASAPAAAAGIGVVTVAMATLVSVAGALLGILVAIAATLATALVGALGIAGGAMIALIATGGLLTAAFMSMTDAQKTLLKDAFQPLKAEMVGLGQIMLKEMVPAFSVWSANLQRALALVTPLASVMGEAFAKAGTNLTAAFSGPGFQALAQSLGSYLPMIVDRLSKALGSFLNGTAGMFAAIMPFVVRFAGHLQVVAEKFSKWANSAQGQSAIEDFMRRALTSLKAVGNAVKEVSGFITDLLFNRDAQNAGNSIFDGIAKTFKSFRETIAKAAADGSLKKWFDDAVKFGGQFWELIKSLWNVLKSLYNSGVLTAIGKTIGVLAKAFNAVAAVLGPLIRLIGPALGAAATVALAPLAGLLNMIQRVGDGISWVLNNFKGLSNTLTKGNFQYGGGGQATAGSAASLGATASSLIASGNSALNMTSVDSGGYRAPKAPKSWKNPYKAWAESLIKAGPSIASQIRNALLAVNKQIATGIRSIAQATDAGEVNSALVDLMTSIRTAAAQTVNTAQETLNSAASRLAGATSKGEALKALRAVKRAQAGVKAALRDQARINNVAKILAAQAVVKNANVESMVAGLRTTNITLAEFAKARGIVAERLAAANDQLADAISMRDDYRVQVADSIREFGSLLSAQAKTINGVQQALTATDITTDLQARLDKIKAFNDNLRLLLAQGLSNAAYKQIVDAGVDAGGAIANALLAGGAGAVTEVNGLIDQIGQQADALGLAASSRMYQAGVDAAQGLVDGLNSLSNQLTTAATALGNAIAASLKKALGIASPSRVMIAAMGDVGDGIVTGLGEQHAKVGTAAGALASKIAVSPEVAAYAASRGAATPVSGNETTHVWQITTPTTDPKAVAQEAINEMTGRL